MKQISILVFCLAFQLGSTAKAKGPLDAKIENPATVAVQELNEANIEQALAEKDAKDSVDSKVALDAKTSGQAKVNVDALGGAMGAVNAQTKETDIPVQLETRKGEAGEGSPFVKMMLGLAVVCGLVVAAWIGVRRYRFNNKGVNPATQMKILSQFHLGPKKSLAIVRVAGESVMIGITEHHISLIKSLALLDEDIPEETNNDFGQVFGKSYAAGTKSTEDGEDFAVSGIKDFVSTRLKNMRTLE